MSKPLIAAFLCALALCLTCACAQSDIPDPNRDPAGPDAPEISPLPPVIPIPEEMPDEGPPTEELADPLEDTQRIAAQEPPEIPASPEAAPGQQSAPSEATDPASNATPLLDPEPEPNQEGGGAVPEAPTVFSQEVDTRLEQAPASAAALFTKIEAELLELINAERQSNGLPLLEMDSAMQFAAQTRAEEALESLSHTRPDGTPYHTAFDEAGFPYAGKWHGENLAVIRVGSADFEDKDIAEALFSQWLSSPGHHQNMLGENFFQTGIGVYLLRDNSAIAIGAAQLFASI